MYIFLFTHICALQYIYVIAIVLFFKGVFPIWRWAFLLRIAVHLWWLDSFASVWILWGPLTSYREHDRLRSMTFLNRTIRWRKAARLHLSICLWTPWKPFMLTRRWPRRGSSSPCSKSSRSQYILLSPLFLYWHTFIFYAYTSKSVTYEIWQ